jgi:hypothetical protein
MKRIALSYSREYGTIHITKNDNCAFGTTSSGVFAMVSWSVQPHGAVGGVESYQRPVVVLQLSEGGQCIPRAMHPPEALMEFGGQLYQVAAVDKLGKAILPALALAPGAAADAAAAAAPPLALHFVVAPPPPPPAV